MRIFSNQGEDRVKEYSGVVAPGKIGSWLDYLLVLLVILSSSFMFLVNYHTEQLMAYTLFSVIIAFFRKERISTLFLVMMMGYAVWVCLQILNYDVWDAFQAGGLFLRMIFAYSVLLILRERFFKVFVDLVWRLALVSIPLYLVGILFPSILLWLYVRLAAYPNLFLFRSGFVVHGHFMDMWSRVNFLIYTFSPQRLSQNHGFMWEPTAFAFMLIFALLFKIMEVGAKFDRQCWILVVALVTTLSTTGYIVMILIAAYLMYISGYKYRILAVFLMVPTLVFVTTSDFLLPKITAEFERGSLVETGYGNSRLSSFIYDIEDVVDHPLLGIGIFEENRYSGNQKHIDVNGLSDTIARFGSIGFSIMLLNLVLSLRRMPRNTRLPNFTLFFILCVFMLSWSEKLMYLPIFFVIQYFHFVINPSKVLFTSNRVFTRTLPSCYGGKPNLRATNESVS